MAARASHPDGHRPRRPTAAARPPGQRPDQGFRAAQNVRHQPTSFPNRRLDRASALAQHLARAPVGRRGSYPPTALESLLSGNGGLTTSALAEQAGANRDQVLRLLRDLETAGRIRRTGQRRGTRWHTITDEDRIRERAAELEATRKRPASHLPRRPRTLTNR